MEKLFNFDFRKVVENINDPITSRARLFTGYRCNIDCKFCFYRGLEPIDIKEEIYKQIELGKKLGIQDWDISGGEPTILPYWFEVLDSLVENGFRKIAVITNGYKISTKNFLKQSVEHGLNEVLFSLHGPNNEIHDGMTGIKGSFMKVMRGIDKAKELDILLRVNTVVTKDNYKLLPDIAKGINMFNPHSFNFLPFRIENTAQPEGNVVNLPESIKYIKEAIDILDKNIIINVRYVPFCLMRGYEKYVSMYIQRAFDSFDWTEYVIRILDCIRRKTEIPLPKTWKDRFELEMESVYETIKDICGYRFSCLKCRCFPICEGIWKNNNKIFGSEEYNPIQGELIKDILYFRR
jgi:MoaA/NifB/PqqE/SkfB family radical SAM enzyme